MLERQLTIRDMQDGEEFATWLSELTDQFPSDDAPDECEERHLILTDEIGDWIGGLRYTIRGGVGTLVDIGVLPRERGQGHAHRLLAAFEHRAVEAGAHAIELWTDHEAEEGFLTAIGWHRVLRRPGYIGGRVWYLLEKRLPPAEG